MGQPVFHHPSALVSPRARIGEGTRIWAFANIQDGAIIGAQCNICDGCYIEKGAVIGNHVTLKNGVNVFDGITISDDVFCGAHTAFINDRNPRSHRDDPWRLERTTVQRGATIGSNYTILCGITIGEYAFIGAGSVVTRDIPAYGLFFGNPAEPHGYMCRCGRKLNEGYRCGHCQRQYELSDTGLAPLGR